MQIYFTKKTKKPDGLNINSPQIKAYDLLISGDSEYTIDNDSPSLGRKNQNIKMNDASEPEEARKLDEKAFIEHTKNKVVSYQFALYHLKKDVYLETVFMFYQAGQFSERASLEEMLLNCAKLLELTPKHLKDIKVLLIAHYSLAEGAHLANRKELVETKKLFLVRKVPVTFEPFKIELIGEKSDGTKLLGKIHGRDTYLLAPDNNKSLDKIGSFTKNKKLFLEEKWYEEIYKLFDLEPEKFINYALNDVRVSF